MAAVPFTEPLELVMAGVAWPATEALLTPGDYGDLHGHVELAGCPRSLSRDGLLRAGAREIPVTITAIENHFPMLQMPDGRWARSAVPDRATLSVTVLASQRAR